jgi:hypothetical protein
MELAINKLPKFYLPHFASFLNSITLHTATHSAMLIGIDSSIHT